MSPRATPLSPDERRRALVEATLPLLLEHGRTVTTRQIARAAGVAEGTIFRVFESKEDLVTAALEHGLDITPFLDELAAIPAGRGLRETMLELAERLQHRFRDIFTLMGAMGLTGPPRAHRHMADGRQRAEEIVPVLLTPFADELTVAPEQLGRMLRLLTFSGTHPHLSDGHPLTAEQVVDVLLDGVRRRDR